MKIAELAGIRIAPQRLLIGLGVVCSLFIAAFDSFRLSSASGRMSADVAAALLSPIYPISTRAVAKDGIATLFVTFPSFTALEADPPYLPYQTQAELVYTLAEARPAAIFFDFIYTRSRDDPAGLKMFAEAVATVRAEGVPVLLGPIGDEPGFADLRAAAEQVDLQWRSDDPLDYPFDGERFFPFSQELQAPTAAKRLYDIVCATEAGRARYKCDLVGKSPKEAVAVEWARGGHPELVDFWDDQVKDCPKQTDGVGAVFNNFMTALARNLFFSLAAQEGTGIDGCTYHLSGPVHLVLDANVGTQAARQIAQRRQLGNAPAEGRVVMVGSALGNDKFDAPGQGIVPGVLHHAMALDNMLSRGSEFRRSPGSIRLGFAREADARPLRIGIGSLIDIALSVGIGFLVSGVIRLRDSQTRSERMSLLISVSAFSLALVIPMVVALLVSFLFHWTAVNVFGIATAALGVTALLEWERVGGVTVKWILVGALAMVAFLALLVGAYVASSASSGATLAFAAAVVGLAVIAAVVLPSSRSDAVGHRGGTP